MNWMNTRFRRVGLQVMGILAVQVIGSSVPAAANAQDVELVPGARVRILVPTVRGGTERVVGNVTAVDSVSITVAPTTSSETDASERHFILAETKQLQVSRGMHPNTGSGFVLGSLFGALFGLLVSSDTHPNKYGAIGGGALGGLLGSVIGAHSKTEKWKGVPRTWDVVRVSPSFQGGGVGVSMSLRFNR